MYSRYATTVKKQRVEQKGGAASNTAVKKLKTKTTNGTKMMNNIAVQRESWTYTTSKISFSLANSAPSRRGDLTRTAPATEPSKRNCKYRNWGLIPWKNPSNKITTNQAYGKIIRLLRPHILATQPNEFSYNVLSDHCRLLGSLNSDK